MYFCLSFCASEQVYLSAHSGCTLCSVFRPNSGRAPGSRAAIVCQSGSAADGLSSPPVVWGPVPLLSHPVMPNSFHLFLCGSCNPSIIIIAQSQRNSSYPKNPVVAGICATIIWYIVIYLLLNSAVCYILM